MGASGLGAASSQPRSLVRAATSSIVVQMCQPGAHSAAADELLAAAGACNPGSVHAPAQAAILGYSSRSLNPSREPAAHPVSFAGSAASGSGAVGSGAFALPQ